MRSGKLLVASCGIVGLAISYAAASDPQYISNRFASTNRPPVREGSTYFARPVPEDQAAAAETESGEQAKQPTKYSRRAQLTPQSASKRHTLTPREASKAPNLQEELFGPAPDGDDSSTSGVVQAGHESANVGGKDSQLINAEYQRSSGANDRNKIRQVGGAFPTRRASLQNADYERPQGATERGQIEQIGDTRDSEPALIHADHDRQPGLDESHHIEQIRGTKSSKPTRTTLINADHQIKRGASTRGQIRQLQSSEGEPILGDELSKEISTEPHAGEVNSFAPARTPSLDAPALEAPVQQAPVKSRNKLIPAPVVKAETTFDDAPDAGAEPSIDSPIAASPSMESDGQTPQVTVQWVKKGDINVGQECQCDLVVKNTGKVGARDIAVDAYFPATVRLTSAEPQPLDKQDHVSWELKELGAGEEHVIHLSMVPTKRGDLATTAFVRFTGAASNVFTVQEPMLAVSAKGPKEVMVGDPASQTVTVTNPGTGVAHNVIIEAVIPEGLEHAHGPKLAMEVGSLNPGESRNVRLALGAIGGGEHTIQIRAKGEGNLEQECTSFITVVAPSLEIGIDGPALRYIGRNAVYVVSVNNDGRADSNNVRVLHRVPDGFKFVRADKGGTFDESTRTISWFVGHVNAGEKTELKAELAATELGTHVHRVGAVSENGTRCESELETAVDGTASLVLEIVDLNDPVEVGLETAYEVRVRNDGTIPAQNVGISCEIPGGVELLGAKGPTDFRAENGLMLFKALSQLEPGKTAVYRINVRGRADGNHRFRARLASDSIKEPLVFEELTKFYGE